MAEIPIEIVYASTEKQSLLELSVPPGSSVADAIRISGIASIFPNENLDCCTAGIWGRVEERQQMLKAGDRVELYRKLHMDPREARRRLALAGRTMTGLDQS